VGHLVESAIRKAKVQASKLHHRTAFEPSSPQRLQLDGRRELPLKSVNG